MKNYGYIYITTNKINGKRYIGQSSYKCGESAVKSYLGSGKFLKKAISKYGSSNFSKEIIFNAFTFDDLNWAEKTLILEFNACKSKNFYNISPGGRASLGFTGKSHSEKSNKQRSEKLRGHPVNDKIRNAVSNTGKITSKKMNSTFVTCPFCNKTGTIGPMGRWHFSKCKLFSSPQKIH